MSHSADPEPAVHPTTPANPPAEAESSTGVDSTVELTAVVAFSCSVLAWMVAPVAAAIVALVLARSADRRIERSGGQRTGTGLVTAARWVAWLNLLVVAMAVAFTASFVLALWLGR